MSIYKKVPERGNRKTAERATRKAIEKGKFVDIFHALAWQCVADENRAVAKFCPYDNTNSCGIEKLLGFQQNILSTGLESYCLRRPFNEGDFWSCSLKAKNL